MTTDKDLTEKKFEDDIERYLLDEGGYAKATMEGYDQEKALYMSTLISFLQTTQPKAWERFVKIYGDKAEAQLYKTFQGDVSRYGLIYVLRHGLDDRGIKLRMAYFAPASDLNPELTAKYRANILTVTRQFRYSKSVKNTIDMVLSLNGIPIVAIELKNQVTGQSVENSKRQWREDRNPKELLFHFDTRILAYFGIYLYEAAMATELKGEKTYFIPFNQGSNGAGKVGGAGNPAAEDGDYVTSYIWKNVLSSEHLLAILQRFIMRQTEKSLKIIVNKHGKEKEVSEESTKIIFPRYHQFDVVERLTADTRSQGSGHNYLIQHSAGSGKSNSIAWLTYRLASLHKEDNTNVFDGVFVITDRRNLNSQLQNTILGFEHIDGQVTTITDKDPSTKLRDAINDGDRIIITTLHRFPIIYKDVESRRGKHYAIIVDEAHSSQSGKAAEKTKAALADTDEALRQLAEIEEREVEELEKERDALMEDLLAQGQHSNLSFYAFTATPKPKTLQTFGIEDGFDDKGNPKYRPYHIYSMLQAIEEGFIKDVLKNYTTFDISYEIAKQVKENPEYEETPATRALKAYYESHQDTINKKVAIIVEKFREVTLQNMDGTAKAMVVTMSRAHALRYFLTIKEYCKEKGYDDVKPMVAFSGKVEYAGKEYTEPMLNSTDERHISEERLPLYFASDIYNMLIVADKYQTGFDEPRLHTMFVDKKLRDVKAVQTLSRLNRWQKEKRDTFVFDFFNSTDEIKNAFEPFYQGTELINPVDVNYVYQFRKDIELYHLWTIADENEFYDKLAGIKKMKKESRLAMLSNTFKPVIDRIGELEEEKQFEVRSKIKNFVRFYSYMAQIARTFDKSLYKAYIFADYLYRVLPKHPHEHPDLSKKVMLLNSKIDEGSMVDIKLEGNAPEIKGENPGGAKGPDDKRDLLDNIIDKVNMMYKGNFGPEDRVILEGIYNRIISNVNDRTKRQAGGNDQTQFIESIFPQIFEQAAMGCYTEQTEAFRRLFENQELYKAAQAAIGSTLYERLREDQARLFTVENLQSKLLPLVREDFAGTIAVSRTLEDTFDAMVYVMQRQTIDKYNGMEQSALDALYHLFCSPGRLTVAEKRTYLRTLVTDFEIYLKKLYYLTHGREVTDRNGSVEYAALSNAVYYLHLDRLQYSEDSREKKFGEFLNILTDLRNNLTHTGHSFTAEELNLGIRITAAMYLYATFRNLRAIETIDMPSSYPMAAEPEGHYGE